MKVILLQDSKDLGKKGSVVSVSDGYARNFLLPRKVAIPATENNMRNLQEDHRREELKAGRLLNEARFQAGALNDATVTVRAKAGETGRLFGSVTSKDVADAIQAAYKLAIDKRRIEVEESVKTIGLYRATLKLHQEVEVSINVKVVAEEDRS
jgi:large subunit ribosomal protein L9